MSNDQNKGIPNGFLNGLYEPEFLPEELRLNEFVYVDKKSEAQEKLARKKKESLRPEIRKTVSTAPIPLTEEEAKQADIEIQATLDRLAETRENIASTKRLIDRAVGDAGSTREGGEIQFDVSINRKPFLKKAVRKLFGQKTDTITYSMYVQALALKREIEQQQAEGYTSGEFFRDEGEE